MPKLKRQPPLPPTIMYAAKVRNQLKSRVTTSHFYFADYPPISARSQQDLDLLRAYRRDLSACNEQACECICHCHQGPTCSRDEGPVGFHLRSINTIHRRTHRECPKGDHHK